MNDQPQEDRDWLLDKSQIVEQPFVSSVPLIGTLIAWIRTQWNSVAAKWYVQPMLEQQNEYNRLLVERVRDFESYVYELSSEQDRDLNRLGHDLATLRLQLKQLNRQLDGLNDHLRQNDINDPQDSEESVV